MGFMYRGCKALSLTALKSLHSNRVNSVTRLAVDDAVHHLAENVKGMYRTPHELTALYAFKTLKDSFVIGL